ncbi:MULTISPECIES: L,D-transpeptidase [Rhodopseudomonas]|uniref:ErfK/YbiS/YcfS/YnhG protein family n=1 Tax=Rhodopseudomonas palustris TaxID=1076 RepID=A0A0D7EN45_RHOPL|nr:MULTISPECIES: L,D-transpeptidase [Rhodopseudomonas]KIZ42234.1 ErfK/YbiS/YcfS/YnhG protein family [Rhodopseudomonas palustris]MDF3809680.1 L,D-transpeptidase [Rhodopseudomonas sp. BAL398]WOK17417.1 L,D-transpeptidase [Rhodopseudomonas sp. BAL398]
MFRKSTIALLTSVSCLGVGLQGAAAFDSSQIVQPSVIYADQPAPRQLPVRPVSAQRSSMGGGFIEFLFSDGAPSRYEQPPVYEPSYQPNYQPRDEQGYDQRRELLPPIEPQQSMGQQEQEIEPAHPAFDPKYEKQLVEYSGKESPGTIVIDTPNKFLYLVQGDGRALRYGIGVGRPGFTWSGVKTISAKKEWPGWTPPPEMLARRPDLPRHMEGGPQNPLGARAMYLGSSLYRIHGSNEPWTIGTNVSSGCIRMRNQDVIDLYGRVRVGARVVVI